MEAGEREGEAFQLLSMCVSEIASCFAGVVHGSVSEIVFLEVDAEA